MRRIIELQQLVLQACLHKDKRLALQALLLDPLIFIPVDRVVDMFDEMCAFCEPHLEGWS